MPLHPRNRHQGHYDFSRLIKASPALASFVAPTPYGELSIDFADPKAVRALNRALLMEYYGLLEWDIPPAYLCPPIPGRADYVHAVADLLGKDQGGSIPKGARIRGLDIGVGSSCIYPLIGYGEYGWSFVGVEVDPVALTSAERIVQANPKLSDAIELRTQASSHYFFRGVVRPDERFEFSICNPPFHASAAEASSGSERKWRNLGRGAACRPGKAPGAPSLNFGGRPNELWCPGGEVAFISQMIAEGREFGEKIQWFTSLLAREDHLPAIAGALEKAQVTDYQVIPMGQGQKKSRVVAWTFLDRDRRETWSSG